MAALPIEDRWILSQVSSAAREVQEALGKFQFARAAGAARDFFWDVLCDWYLELVKARIRDDRQAAEARQVLAFALDQSLRLMHPFMPFITERLWSILNDVAPHRRRPRGAGATEKAEPGAVEPGAIEPGAVAPGAIEPGTVEAGAGGLDTDGPLIVASYPPVEGWADLDAPEADRIFADLQTATRAVRDIRQKQDVPPRQKVDVTIKVPAERVASLKHEAHVIRELAGVGELTIDPDAAAPKNAATLVIGDMHIYVADVIDPAAERQRLEKELAGLDKQIAGIEGKLGNESFVGRAPAEVVQRERDRLGELKAKRETVVATMGTLG